MKALDRQLGGPCGNTLELLTQLQKCCLFDTAAEQKARATYEHLMVLTDDPAIINPLRFLREREIVHFQRFGECLNILQSSITAGLTLNMNPASNPCADM